MCKHEKICIECTKEEISKLNEQIQKLKDKLPETQRIVIIPYTPSYPSYPTSPWICNSTYTTSWTPTIPSLYLNQRKPRKRWVPTWLRTHHYRRTLSPPFPSRLWRIDPPTAVYCKAKGGERALYINKVFRTFFYGKWYNKSERSSFYGCEKVPKQAVRNTQSGKSDVSTRQSLLLRTMQRAGAEGSDWHVAGVLSPETELVFCFRTQVAKRQRISIWEQSEQRKPTAARNRAQAQRVTPLRLFYLRETSWHTSYKTKATYI